MDTTELFLTWSKHCMPNRSQVKKWTSIFCFRWLTEWLVIIFFDNFWLLFLFKWFLIIFVCFWCKLYRREFNVLFFWLRDNDSVFLTVYVLSVYLHFVFLVLSVVVVVFWCLFYLRYLCTKFGADGLHHYALIWT